MSHVTEVRRVLRARIICALADRIDLTTVQVVEIESIAYNSVQNLHPKFLVGMMRRTFAETTNDLMTIRMLSEIPFVIAAELGMDIIAARHADTGFFQDCA